MPRVILRVSADQRAFVPQPVAFQLGDKTAGGERGDQKDTAGDDQRVWATTLRTRLLV
jgi:hypothetical protein